MHRDWRDDSGLPAYSEGKRIMAPKKTPLNPTETEQPKTTKKQKPQKQSKGKREPKEKKVSALDAAAKLLAETGEPMNCQEMVKGMSEKGYWTSPGGQTPHATLYSAISRELKTKGAEARFRKAERGRFAANPAK
jgi:hypothetical protein